RAKFDLRLCARARRGSAQLLESLMDSGGTYPGLPSSTLKAAMLALTGMSFNLTPLHWIVIVFAVSATTCVPGATAIALYGAAMPILSASAGLAAELMSLTYAQYVAGTALRSTKTLLLPSGDTNVAVVSAKPTAGANMAETRNTLRTIRIIAVF